MKYVGEEIDPYRLRWDPIERCIWLVYCIEFNCLYLIRWSAAAWSILSTLVQRSLSKGSHWRLGMQFLKEDDPEGDGRDGDDDEDDDFDMGDACGKALALVKQVSFVL